MKAIVLSLFLAPLTLLAATFPYPIRQTVLENGLTVVSIRFPSPKILSYYTIVRTGSRNEIEPGKTGFAHFFEHLMFRGTKANPSKLYESTLQSYGADRNAFTNEDWTGYHATASTAALPDIVRLEADRFQNLSYSLTDFQQEAGAVLGEYEKSTSSPYSLIEEVVGNTVYQNQTYRHTVIGYEKDIRSMPSLYEYSKEFFQRWYRPDNTFILVVGDVDHDALMKLIRPAYSSWKPGTPTLEIAPEPPQKAERRVTLTWGSPTTPLLGILYRIPAFEPSSRQLAALSVIREALFSSTGTLYRKLVLEKKLIEGISADSAWKRGPSLFSIMARIPEASKIKLVEKEILTELEQLTRKGIDKSRLEAIKSHLRYSTIASLDTPDEVAGYFGNLLQLTGSIRTYDQLSETIDAVSSDDVRKTARETFQKATRTVITLTEGKATTGPEITPVAYPAKLVPPKPTKFNESTTSAGSNSIESPLVSFRLAFRLGSQNDPKGKEGLSHLTASLMEEGGTKNLTYSQFLEKLYPMGAEFRYSIDNEYTVFMGTVHKDSAKQYFPLVLEPMTSPGLRPGDFSRIRRDFITYISHSLKSENDEALSKQVLRQTLYPEGHPYHALEAGTLDSLKRLTLEDAKAFHRSHFRSGNYTLLVSGSDADKIRSTLDAGLKEKLPKGTVDLPELPPMKRLKDIEVTIVEKKTTATAISIGCPLDINRSDDDFYRLFVANSALGEHRMFQGRLMRHMRMLRGLNYGDYSYVESFAEDGGTRFAMPNVPLRQQYFSIWIRPVAPANAGFAIRQAIRELDLFVTNGLTPEEFDQARSFIRNVSKLWVQTQSRLLGFQLDGLFYGKKDFVTELEARIPTMTLKEVNASIQRHLQSKNLAVAVITQPGSNILQKLKSGVATPIHYQLENVPEELKAEDKIIESYPLAINPEASKTVSVDSLFVR